LKPANLRDPRIAAALALIFSALIFAAPAFAAEEGAGPENSPAGWVFRWLNFAIVFAAILWAFSKAGPYFRARAESIQAAVAEGTRAREEAEAKKRDAEARLANLPAEIGALKAQARRDAEADRERIKAMTREEAAKVERAADIEIAAAERTAILALKSFTARLAVERAEVLLREQITPGSDSVIVSVFVADLASSGSAN
jgi:F-type H+-transporting ATPase subunit b